MPNTSFALKIVLCIGLLFGLSTVARAHTDVTTGQAQDMINTNSALIVVDVREISEYCNASGHIPGALNYPWSSGVLQARYAELPVSADILVVCQSGGRSNSAANFLDSQGFLHVYDMLGGMSIWQGARVGCVDSDGDGINDDLDNCPADNNPVQEDRDGDGTGDVCDPDNDNDGICDPGRNAPSCSGADNCPYISNPSQDNADGDSAGDVCDTCTDTDRDDCGNPGFPANTCPLDNCPSLVNPVQQDGDCDGIGDVCDASTDCMPGTDCDNDCDGFYNQADNCINHANPGQEDTSPPQGNGCGDACECEGNFDGDADVDGSDAQTFKTDFGRSQFSRPCTGTDPCNGDFICDKDVDGSDAQIFKKDFGRSQFKYPCADCVTDPWCIYP